MWAHFAMVEKTVRARWNGNATPQKRVNTHIYTKYRTLPPTYRVLVGSPTLSTRIDRVTALS